MNPDLIPVPGVLVSLQPLKDEGYLVDLNTRGAGTGIGYLANRDDGRVDVRLGTMSIGIADKPETGMWAVLKAYTGDKFYDKLVAGFEPHEDAAATPPLNEVVEFHGIKWRFTSVEPNNDGRYGFEVRHFLRDERYGYVTQEEDGTFGAMGLREEDGFVGGFASWQWAGRFLITHRRPQKIDVEL
ncbi:hypothetical protein [Streptomyces sp. NPDC057002]|uniref:hypothetical protein n=1 Tax=Streptomyces sp. NPDC057002 TaxID=3345992 RepID=UPI00363011D3